MTNNSVYDWRGNLIGFRCDTCNEVVQKMWGDTCNACRKRDEQVDRIVAAIREKSA